MTSTASDRILRVADLVDRPGASRRVDLDLSVPDDLHLELAEVAAPLHLAGVVESVVDGLLVRGELSTAVRTPCARCLVPMTHEVAADVVELFTDPADLGEGEELDPGYELGDGTVDLDTLLRDTLVPAVPYRPLCDRDCRGLCPECGVNRNEVECVCTQTDDDPRWAALSDLRLPDAD
ncbi:MAG: YceD family protein [Egibacteraceae bacterium]